VVRDHLRPQHRDERALLGGHVGVEVFREAVELERDDDRRLIEDGPHRDVLGEVLLDHPLDQLVAPAVRAREQRPDHLALAEVVLVDLGAHPVERELELGLGRFIRAHPPRDPEALGKARANRFVLGEQQLTGVVSVHIRTSTQVARQRFVR